MENMEKLESRIAEVIRKEMHATHGNSCVESSKQLASEMTKTHIAFALWLEKERLSIEYSTPNEQYQLFSSFITNYYK